MEVCWTHRGGAGRASVHHGDCSSIGQSTGLWLRGLRVQFPSVTLRTVDRRQVSVRSFHFPLTTDDCELSFRSVAQLVEHWSPKPAVGGSSPSRPVRCLTARRKGDAAVSSRGLGRSPLKAQTRVRIPLPLLGTRGPFVYRSGRHPFTVQRGVRFPYGLCTTGWQARMGIAS